MRRTPNTRSESEQEAQLETIQSLWSGVVIARVVTVKKKKKDMIISWNNNDNNLLWGFEDPSYICRGVLMMPHCLSTKQSQEVYSLAVCRHQMLPSNWNSDKLFVRHVISTFSVFVFFFFLCKSCLDVRTVCPIIVLSGTNYSFITFAQTCSRQSHHQLICNYNKLESIISKTNPGLSGPLATLCSIPHHDLFQFPEVIKARKSDAVFSF